MRKIIRASAIALMVTASAGAGTAALAHMPYLLPTTFDVGKGDHVTILSAFGEDAFVPELAMRDAPFTAVGPAGGTVETGRVTYLRDLSIFETDLKTDGTYRLSTGQRAGRIGQMAQVDGKWVMRGEGPAAASDAPQVAVQSMTLAEAFVTRGAPTDTALRPHGVALEVQPVTHPNAITVGGDADFVLLFDGKPLPATDVTLFRAAGNHDGRKIAGQFRTDAVGRFRLKPQDAGIYLLLARHRTAAPAGATTPYRSYTYTLAFDAA